MMMYKKGAYFRAPFSEAVLSLFKIAVRDTFEKFPRPSMFSWEFSEYLWNSNFKEHL